MRASSGATEGSVIEPARRKRWATKVRTGCTTCRSRRIKCDEGKPACRRCSSTGRECGGYVQGSVQGGVPKSRPLISVLQTSTALTAPCESASPQERHMFHIFRTETVTEVSGAFDRNFWTVDVMRATESYRPVWHAALAVAAMHKRLGIAGATDDERRSREELYMFALSQYNKAIEFLIDIVRQPELSHASQETMLIANVLFTGLSSLRGDLHEVMVHINNGLQLFYQWDFAGKAARDADPKSILPSQSLVALFNRLEGQFLCSGLARPAWRGPMLPRPSSLPFATTTDAYFELQPLIGNMVTLILEQKHAMSTRTSNPMPDVRTQYRHALSIWKAKFLSLKQSDSLAKVDAEGLTILEMWSTSLEITMHVDVGSFEVCWDKYRYAFLRLVELAEQLWEERCARKSRQAAGPSVSTPLPTFSFSPSICEPLFMAASCCRDHSIRHRALELLKKQPQKEAAWDTRFMAGLVELKIMVEERGALFGSAEGCGCIPQVYICNGHRVLYMQIVLPGMGPGRLTFKTVNDYKWNLPGKAVVVVGGDYFITTELG